MGEKKEKLLPGTAMTYADTGEKGFSKVEMLIEATGGLSLSQVCAVTGLEGSTIQNWVKRGWVDNPNGKKYDDIHIARILIINALKECIKLEHIDMLMRYVNEAAHGENIIKESELYSFLCSALAVLGRADDLSRSGVEAVAEAVTKDYVGPKPGSRITIRRALTVMIYACVCSDVKRRTEMMMKDILREYNNLSQERSADEGKIGGEETASAGDDGTGPEEYDQGLSESSGPDEGAETGDNAETDGGEEADSDGDTEKNAEQSAPDKGADEGKPSNIANWWFRRGSKG